MTIQNKRLYRSQNDRMLAGVCGGLGEYFEIDPTLVRLGFVLLGVLSFGIPIPLLYVVMAIVVPESPTISHQINSPVSTPLDSKQTATTDDTQETE